MTRKLLIGIAVSAAALVGLASLVAKRQSQSELLQCESPALEQNLRTALGPMISGTDELQQRAGRMGSGIDVNNLHLGLMEANDEARTYVARKLRVNSDNLIVCFYDRPGSQGGNAFIAEYQVDNQINVLLLDQDTLGPFYVTEAMLQVMPSLPHIPYKGGGNVAGFLMK